MTDLERLGAALPGDTPDLERRQSSLMGFLAAYEHGGIDEAAATLGREFAALERTFAQHLGELHQLL